ncbi:MAG: 50S ribosomal protein L4 [Candidatus Improbicoccus devescovinae]|nr:MAG: 50S ribosomal protein L4 [Candidatus Improbicoccus devescovinae]
MPKHDVVDVNGVNVGEIDLNDSVFLIKPNMSAVHLAMVAYLAAQRVGTKSCLTRAEVSGGGRKPWRQKGTGHARQGSTRAPQWRHGGVVFAPKPRDFSIGINKKVRRLAIRSVFSLKFLNGDIIVLDDLVFNEIKTKNMVNILKNIGATDKALIVLPSIDEKVIKSSRNIKGVTSSQVDNLNIHNLFYSGKLVMPKSSVRNIEEMYAS